jgi:hypothetical protein
VIDFDVAKEMIRFGAAGIARENIACARLRSSSSIPTRRRATEVMAHTGRGQVLHR